MKRRRAIFTLVRNESFFLPLWLQYYNRYFAYQDIYVIDHETNDGSTDNLPCNTILLKHEYTNDTIFFTEVLNDFQNKLLRNYQYVVCADADEFIYHENGLDVYIDNLMIPSVTCNGYEIVHKRASEPPLNIHAPILRQRNYWVKSSLYSKPTISSVPSYWSPGLHSSRNAGPKDDNLILLHLKRVDYNIALEKNKRNASTNLSQYEIVHNLGYQFWITGDRFENWFDNDFYGGYTSANIELIPDSIKEKFPI